MDHLTVFHTDIEKLLQKQRSLIYDLETSKVKVSDSQKRGVDMIKKGMVNNRSFCFTLLNFELNLKIHREDPAFCSKPKIVVVNR